ncbi:MAG: ABC transporter ATP-binding protein [Piscinibacter sp.]|nr:ABC transporter ATP-binding protein [Piscinibacter sp.]
MASVTIDSLDIVFGNVAVLKNLSLAVADGEFLVLLGPSGCGKSTLLHTLAGFNEVSAGSVRIGERDVTWADPKDREIGMVFQSYALYPTMNVERNMSFGLRVAGVPRDEIERRVGRAAQMLHLTDLLGRRPSQLSGGQRQRVAIGRALVRDAQVYLFDEPLSNLDAKLRAELRRELKQLHLQLGTTMVYVTHDQVEAMTLASRIAVMQGGRIQQIDTPHRVYDAPANMFVAGFLGSPSMNFVQGRLQRGPTGLGFVSDALRVDVSGYAFAAAPPADGAPVVLGVRPEHLELRDDGAAGRARVSLVEPMGSNQVVWLDATGSSIAVEIDAGHAPAVGQEIGLAVRASAVSLFDPQTQARL